MSARPFLPEEIRQLAAYFAARGAFRDRMLLLVGSNVGYRISELCTLKIGQVLTATGAIAHEVTVTRAFLKGGQGARQRSVRNRRVVLNETARGAIADYIATLGRVPLPEERLFRSREGANQAVSRSQVHRILRRACSDLGLNTERVSSHSLRKSFARAVFDATGHDLVRTQRIIGHSSPLVTAQYLENTTQELDEVVLGLQLTAPAIGANELLTVGS